ncbi:MAG TPA: hypothetical protein VGN17_29445 [Bryobacteraceae bacterium]|jgi:hypothetical protein
MVHQEVQPSGRLKITAVANFHAHIARDIVIDDGEQERREFGIEAELAGNRLAFSVSAAEFVRMDWVLTKLGPRAIIFPGQQQHVRAAIQWLSGEIRQERIFTHLGWRKHGACWMYLHAGGAVGADGPVANVQVHLPGALQSYLIPQPKDSDDGARAVRDSLRFLDVAPDRITFPLLAGAYAAALGSAGFSLFLAGKSGVFKSALAALCQQHFGPAMEASRLPANFSCTANALESLAFHAKDALMVADDFAPKGMQDRGLESVAERLFRAAGNQQGRSRLRNSGPSATQPPRALLLATGEEVPQGQSIRARLLVIELDQGEVDLTTLTGCQKAAQQGRFAVAMGSFLIWVASRYAPLRQRLRGRVEEIRGEGRGRGIHARLPSAVAELQAGFEIFLEFAGECGAIANFRREELAFRSVTALNELIARQAKYHRASDPAVHFLQLLRDALSHGQAHLADRDGRAPEQAATWGWRRSQGRSSVPHGAKVGWIVGPNIYLDPAASYQVAQQMAGNEPLQVSEQALRQRLRERHLLASVDAGRRMLLVRRTLEDRPHQVLHLKAPDLTPRT